MKRQVLKGRLVILLGVAGVVCAGTVFAHEIQFRRQANLLAHQAEDLVNQGNKATALQVFQQYLNFRPKDGLVMNRYVEVLEESITPTEKNLRPKDRDQRLLIDSLERLLLLDDAPRYDKRKKLIGLLMTYRFYSNASMHLKLLKDDPESKLQDDAWLWEELAKCELGESKYQNLDQACEYLRSAVACKSKPARPETYAYLATILRKDVNTKPAKDEADRMIEELILLNPDDPKARLIRAEYLLAIPEKDANQNQTLSKDVDFLRKSAVGADANILYAVAKMELDGGKLEQARTFLTAGAKSFPDQQRFHLVLATVLLKLGETEQAKTELKTLVGQLPPTDRYYFAALDELVDLGETALVTTAIPKLDATESTRPYADYLRGRLAIKTGDWAVALGLAEASYSAIERTAGFEGRGHLLIARCQDLAGNPDAQLASATAALRANRTLVPAKLLQANAREKLGQFGPAAEIYREILTIDPAVKPLLAKVLLNEQLYRDPSTRSWRELEELLKDKSPTPDLVVLQALMLVKQNRPDEAMRAVEAAVAKDAKQPQLQVALAHLRASHVNPQAGLTTLEEAEKLIGDTVEFRLARANILTRDPATSDTPRIAALSEKADAFAARDRYRLWSSLGETFIALNRPPEAERLYRKAADLIPTDLPSRLALYDIAINTKQYPKASAIATEVQGIEGQTGPHATVLRTFVEMKTLDPKQKSRLIELRRQVEAARSKKSGWSSLYACLGDLNRMLDNEDAALENYIRAIDLGDRNPALVRVAYQMLMSRRQFEQANAVVARAGRTSATENVRWGSAWGLSTSDPKAAMTERLRTSDAGKTHGRSSSHSISKPFGLAVCNARVGAIARRCSSAAFQAVGLSVFCGTYASLAHTSK